MECKAILAEKIIESLKPFQQRRKEILADKGYVKALLREGAKKTLPIAQETLKEVRKRLNLSLNGG